ncbi:MAG: adenylyltransferase/cytidyltransferase family protein [Verrucomicrobiota bacterium]
MPDAADPIAAELAAKRAQDAELQRVLSAHPDLALADIPKVRSMEAMAAERDRLDARGERLVITSGCFDVLHGGHRAYLPAARAAGDALVVALNDDASVRKLKGPDRPVRPAAVRAWLLAELDAVDYITVFPQRSVAAPILAIRPHVYAKGGDYTLETIHQDVRAAVEQIGAEARFLNLVPGVSTTEILRRERADP